MSMPPLLLSAAPTLPPFSLPRLVEWSLPRTSPPWNAPRAGVDPDDDDDDPGDEEDLTVSEPLTDEESNFDDFDDEFDDDFEE
ncbi:MAG: hypothetical protein ACKOCN_09770, partial [Planctomycetaceae bacterium]